MHQIDNPYTKTQNGFNTFGGPDITSTFATVARQALNVVWYQKWYVHLRHRPESGGALVFQRLESKPSHYTEASKDLKDTVLKSHAVECSHAENNKSYFLSQAFPEGSPVHPSYPTGHGTVAGACITVLKFFFDGESPGWILAESIKDMSVMSRKMEPCFSNIQRATPTK